MRPVARLGRLLRQRQQRRQSETAPTAPLHQIHRQRLHPAAPSQRRRQRRSPGGRSQRATDGRIGGVVGGHHVAAGSADATGPGQRARTPADAESQRGLRRPAQDHSDPALRQIVQNSDAQIGRPLHRFPLSGLYQISIVYYCRVVLFSGYKLHV